MSNEWESMLDRIRNEYHTPTETPRDEMWRAIEAEMGSGETPVVDLAAERARRKATPRWAGIGIAAAAAAVLVLGVGIGRFTAPSTTAPDIVAEGIEPTPSASAISLVAQAHLGRTESVLTMARADARSGRIDPLTAEWASELLTETRILIDTQADGTEPLAELLMDLELVLVQIVGAAEGESMEETLGRTELELALRSLDEGEVLPRLQAALPSALAGV